MENTNTKPSMFKNPVVQSILGIIVILLMLSGILGYKIYSHEVYTELGTIEAPIINIGSESAGVLDVVYVHPGDTVTVGQALAHVGGDTLYAKVNGVILTTNDVPGQIFAPGTPVVTMIDPTALRVQGTIDENKGFADIEVGDTAVFTVDAFGSKKFTGVVEEVSPTSKESGVVFSVSDKREIKKFTFKIKYDTSAHPEFKNGMSAKITVYTK